MELTNWIIYFLIINIIFFVTTWKLYQKAGRKSWEAAIPIYNIYVMIKIIHRPWWWIIILVIPIVGPIMGLIILVDFVRHFNRRSLVGALLVIFLSFLFLGYLNYSPETKYTGKEERKETLVSAVLFAVIFATIIHTFIIQPFTIPTGSMERTLLVGDFLFVSKMSYGIRLPMTPVALPFLQNKIPLGDSNKPQDQTDSYVDKIRLPYMRLPGWNKIERYDIVVFNYPTDSLHTAIDRKDPYVKRCVGLPGDKIQIINGDLLINDKPEELKKDEEQQKSSLVYATEAGISSKVIEQMFGYAEYRGEMLPTGKYRYLFTGLTKENAEKIRQLNTVDSVVVIYQQKGEGIRYKNAEKTRIDYTNSIFGLNDDWNGSQFGPITIPKKGEVITLTSKNINQYKRLIKVYENNDFIEKEGKYYINGKEANNYTIKQDYYWMMGDNRDNSLDGRYFGFVPESHIIGSPIFTWMSVQGWFENDPVHPAKSKIRLDRMFRIPNTDQAPQDKTNYLPYFLVLVGLYFAYDFYRGKKKKKQEKQQE